MPDGTEPSRGRWFWIADTSALVLFFTAVGVINERLVAEMTWAQVLHARLLGISLMLPVARPYGVWRDWLMRHASETSLSRVFWDSLALVTFQVPIYAAIIAVSGAEGLGLLKGGIGATVIMLAAGRPYGVFLNWIRGLFGLPREGSKRVSPHD